MTDTMISFKDNSLATKFLSEEELKIKAPYIFVKEPTNPKVSGKYVQATTIDVIRDMSKMGWYPVEAKQCRPKKNSAGIRSFHMVAFQNPDVKIVKSGDNGEEIVDCWPRIILQNSHDGFNSFKFMCACFRVVCSNGLIIATDALADMSIRHINYTQEELRKVVITCINEIPKQVDIINKMKHTNLTFEQKKTFATEAVKVRKGMDKEDKYILTEEEVLNILNPERMEDNGDSLWSVFNVLQEHVIKGGYSLNGKNGKSRKQRGITSVKKDLDINNKLFEIANSYLVTVNA